MWVFTCLQLNLHLQLTNCWGHISIPVKPLIELMSGRRVWFMVFAGICESSAGHHTFTTTYLLLYTYLPRYIHFYTFTFLHFFSYIPLPHFSFLTTFSFSHWHIDGCDSLGAFFSSPLQNNSREPCWHVILHFIQYISTTQRGYEGMSTDQVTEPKHHQQTFCQWHPLRFSATTTSSEVNI